ncbi:MAG: zinc-ribbon domain-containing protein [Acidobacteriota bacterium]|nr:zinc-ribbon domain-containing protein [Acidobacteriota bacterium]
MSACTNCGKPVSTTDRFCTGCGSPVAHLVVPPPPDASATTVTQTVSRSALHHAPTTPAPAVQKAAEAPSLAPAAGASTAGGFATSEPKAAVSFSQREIPAYTSGSASTTAPEITLLPQERQLYEASFAPKLLAPHLLTYLTVTDKRVIVRHPNTIFGFVPLGYFMSSAPHSSVQQVDSGMNMRSTKVLGGGAALLMGLWFIFSAFGGYRGVDPVSLLMGLIIGGAGIAVLLTAKAVGVFIHTGGAAMHALARGNQLAEVQRSAQTVTALLLETEKSRGV